MSQLILKRSSNFLLIAALVPGLTVRVFAGAGTTGGNVLEFPVGARAIAMGQAYTAQADDVSSLYWNPAGIAILNQSQASFMYNQLVQGQTYSNVAVATPLENGGIGGSISYLGFGSISGYDANANPTGSVNAYSGVGTLGGGWLLGPLSLGANIKGVQAQLADVSATGVAADVGGIWTFQKEVMGGTIRAGATVRNIGSGLNFINQNDPFPLEWRLGVAAVQMMDRRLNVSLDYGKQIDLPGALYTGVEYWVVPMVALRIGYAGTDQEGSGLTAGLGLKIKDFSFDYAYSSYGDLGMTQRYEISMRFGVIQPRLTPEERTLFKRAKLALARGYYEEAALLFDSLMTMEPDYRPFRRYFQLASKDTEKRDEEVNAVGTVNFKALHPDDDGTLDQNELTDLLKQGENGEAVAKTNETSAEESTLAPYIPSNEPEAAHSDPEAGSEPEPQAAPLKDKPDQGDVQPPQTPANETPDAKGQP